MMETRKIQTGTTEDALRIAILRRERKSIARNLRRESGLPLAADIRATFERGDWS